MEELEEHHATASLCLPGLFFSGPGSSVPEMNRAGGTVWLEAAVMLKSSVSDSGMRAGVKAPVASWCLYRDSVDLGCHV